MSVCPGADTALFSLPGGSRGSAWEITARVRIELPRYRVRGACGLFFRPEGFFQLDFDHSSLFGSLREEATIIIADGTISIHDGQRGTVVEHAEALAMLKDHLGLEVFPDDLLCLLLLRPIRFDDRDPVLCEDNDGSLTVRGRWRGREVEIAGERGMPPRRLIVVAPGGVGYETRYGYGRGVPGGYPERIVCERIGGVGRISLSIESALDAER